MAYMSRGASTGSMDLKHNHPYNIAELHDLDTNLISEEILRLQKSMNMLTTTNATLSDSLQGTNEDDLSPEDAKLFQETIQENAEAIKAQQERIEMCIFVLKKRLGIDPTNKHYDLNPDTTAITARDVASPGDVAMMQQEQAQGHTTLQPQEQQSVDQQQSPSHAQQQQQHADEQDGGMYL